MNIDHVLVRDFALLHQGGATADAGDSFRPRKDGDGKPTGFQGHAFELAIQEHLYHDSPLGIYPLIPSDPPTVWFGLIDWDAPRDPEPERQAANVTAALKHFGVTAFTEVSRNKGFHLWVYAQEPICAQLMRNALIAACQLADSPILEVYPKQVALTGKGFGNGIRLPYPSSAEEGRQIIRLGSWTLTVQEFVKEAMAARVSKEKLEQIAALLPSPTLPPSPVVRRRRSDMDKLPVPVQEMLEYGPLGDDRSASLFTFACHLAGHGEPKESALPLMMQFDERWLQKFSTRADRDVRLDEMFDKAVQEVSYSQPSLYRKEQP